MRPLVVALLLAAPAGWQIDLPVAGWSSAQTVHLVARWASGDRAPPADLLWLGRRWGLLPAAGSLSAWLPLVPGLNRFVVEGGGAHASVQLERPGEGPDLVVVAGWPAVGARLDLRVSDPFGEPCDAGQRQTRQGGVRLRDDPESPGPHVFVLPRASAGEYQISILCGRLATGFAVPIQATVLLHPGTSREERFDLAGVVSRCDEVTEIGSVQVAGRLPSPG